MSNNPQQSFAEYYSSTKISQKKLDSVGKTFGLPKSWSATDMEQPILSLNDIKTGKATADNILVTIVKLTVFILNILGQALQNITLPLALSSHPAMCIFLVYTAFVYCLFFTIVDVVLDVFIETPREASLIDHPTLPFLGSLNAFNGIGAVFGGSPDRTPLTLQMSSSLVVNLISPFYKMLIFRIPFTNVWKHIRRFSWYIPAAICYLVAFILTLIDKLNNTESGKMSWFSLVWLGGVFFGMIFNIHQEKMMIAVPLKTLNFPQQMKFTINLLRQQTTWLFIFTWFSVALSMIPGFDEAGTLTYNTFYDAWANFLPFTNFYMNLFNLGYLIQFCTGVLMNKFESSFNNLTSNISAVLTLWTGWVPAIMDATVGFVPSIPMTVTAMVLSVIAIFPSYYYGIAMADVTDEVLIERAKEDEEKRLLKEREELYNNIGINES